MAGLTLGYPLTEWIEKGYIVYWVIGGVLFLSSLAILFLMNTRKLTPGLADPALKLSKTTVLFQKVGLLQLACPLLSFYASRS